MSLQLIFVVETNKTCKSDWIYIKDTYLKWPYPENIDLEARIKKSILSEEATT